MCQNLCFSFLRCLFIRCSRLVCAEPTYAYKPFSKATVPNAPTLTLMSLSTCMIRTYMPFNCSTVSFFRLGYG